MITVVNLLILWKSICLGQGFWGHKKIKEEEKKSKTQGAVLFWEQKKKLDDSGI